MGQMLGMPRSQINEKIEDIIDFSGVRNFIDTPVKFYSSGMYVRLAFAIAVHIDPDVLIVDEVLSVGDMEFQKKSLKRMREFIGNGRTVIFVSHSMDSVSALCTRTILLDKGKVVLDGETDEVIGRYTGEKTGDDGSFDEFREREGKQGIRLERANLLSKEGFKTKFIQYGDAIEVDLELANKYKKTSKIRINFDIVVKDTERWVSSHTNETPFSLKPSQKKIRVRIPVSYLSAGFYKMNISLFRGWD